MPLIIKFRILNKSKNLQMWHHLDNLKTSPRVYGGHSVTHHLPPVVQIRNILVLPRRILPRSIVALAEKIGALHLDLADHMPGPSRRWCPICSSSKRPIWQPHPPPSCVRNTHGSRQLAETCGGSVSLHGTPFGGSAVRPHMSWCAKYMPEWPWQSILGVWCNPPYLEKAPSFGYFQATFNMRPTRRWPHNEVIWSFRLVGTGHSVTLCMYRC